MDAGARAWIDGLVTEEGWREIEKILGCQSPFGALRKLVRHLIAAYVLAPRIDRKERRTEERRRNEKLRDAALAFREAAARHPADGTPADALIELRDPFEVVAVSARRAAKQVTTAYIKFAEAQLRRDRLRRAGAPFDEDRNALLGSLAIVYHNFLLKRPRLWLRSGFGEPTLYGGKFYRLAKIVDDAAARGVGEEKDVKRKPLGPLLHHRLRRLRKARAGPVSAANLKTVHHERGLRPTSHPRSWAWGAALTVYEPRLFALLMSFADPVSRRKQRRLKRSGSRRG
jgi:hypothetical protein